MANSNLLIILLIVIIIIMLIYFYDKNKNKPIPNSGSIPQSITNPNVDNNLNLYNDNLNDNLNTDLHSDILNDKKLNHNKKSNNIMFSNDLMSSNDGIISPSDPTVSKYSTLTGHELSDDPSENEFTYKKQKFIKKTPDDIKDLFDVEKLKPQEYEDWFDVVPHQNTKKIKGTHLIHPKEHLGISTTGSSKKGGMHDIRGPVKISNQKMNVGPWGISTMQPDDYGRGLCDSY